MRILLVNYGQADNNSANHIHGLARGLASSGHEVLVGVAKPVTEGEFVTREGFRMASHRAILKCGPGFAGHGKADVVHLWTPRETMRRFFIEYGARWGTRALVIHLEDNEVAIFERFTGRTIEEALVQEQDWPKGLIHPAHHRPFLDSAQGLTMVHECLRPMVPVPAASLELVPVMDFDFFSPTGPDGVSRATLGLGARTRVIVYNGNDHAATAGDIRLLYDAVDLLIERGRDVALVRTGHVLPTNYDGLQFRPGPRCIEQGFISREQVPAVMRLADLVIQPGNADAFNSFRLPAKVPEYLSMGRPLITGAGNIGAELLREDCAVVLPHMTPQTIADAACRLLDNPTEAAALGARGRDFSLRRFKEEAIVPRLEEYYEGLLGEISKRQASSNRPAAPIPARGRASQGAA